MAGLMDGVNLRTQLVGQNRLELLLFNLGERQRYGINVFKVQEVIQCPPLTALPKAADAVKGIVNMRGRTIPVIDLRMAVGKTGIEDVGKAYVIVTEYNRRVQGLLVNGVDRIVNMVWNDILPPPQGMGKRTYLTAVTRVDDELIEIIDVEKVLAEISGINMEVSGSILAERNEDEKADYHVLVADDSSVARNQVRRTLEQLGIRCTLANDGQEALSLLKAWAAAGPIKEQVSFLISDIEMPKMDGYTLTSEVRRDNDLVGLYIIMHTSMSGMFNTKLVEKVGADRFLPKFNPDELAKVILELVREGVVKPVAAQRGKSAG